MGNDGKYDLKSLDTQPIETRSTKSKYPVSIQQVPSSEPVVQGNWDKNYMPVLSFSIFVLNAQRRRQIVLNSK